LSNKKDELTKQVTLTMCLVEAATFKLLLLKQLMDNLNDHITMMVGPCSKSATFGEIISDILIYFEVKLPCHIPSRLLVSNLQISVKRLQDRFYNKLVNQQLTS